MSGSDLKDYLAAEAAKPYCWGKADCATFFADWMTWRGGQEMPVELPIYHDEASLSRLLAVTPFALRMHMIMRKAGWIVTKTPLPGDVLYVEVKTSEGDIRRLPAILGDKFTLMRLDDGITATRNARHLLAWTRC